MSHVLRLAIVDPRDRSREELKSMLLGMDTVWLEAECSRYEFFPDVVAQTDPDVAIIHLDADQDKALSLVQRLRESSPGCSVIAVSSSTDGTVILRAMRSGVKEFVPWPLRAEELVAAFDRVAALQHSAGGGKPRSCRIVAIAGSGGGVGSTSIAVNLGCVLAANEVNSVALIDLDLALGDADVFLDTIPDYTLSDISQNIARLDFALLKRSLTKHASGLYLLPRPVQLQESEMITVADLQRVIGMLKATFTHLILDLSKSYSEFDMLALRESENVLLITQLDLPSLRNVVRLMASFGEIEGVKEKTRIVVNRVGLDSGQISLKKAKETIGGEIFWQIPNDYRVMSEVRNNGIPLLEQAPKASISQSIVGLASTLSEAVDPATLGDKGKAGRWLNFWPTKGKPAPS
ncbi:MAG TPA: AAA family ATPase [Pirellulaceae bacterium]